MSKDEKPELSNTRTDYAVMGGRAVAGVIPFAGSFIAEIIQTVVPNQRFDRLVEYVKRIDARVTDLTEAERQEIATSAKAVDLFEEGGTQAARALSEERLDYIASLVAFGLTGGERARTEAKRLLGLLESVDDDQIIILASHLHKNLFSDEFRERHEEMLKPALVHMQSPREEIDKATIHHLARADLVRLGLLRNRFSKPRKGELPVFDDKTGMIKASGYDITPLGRLILRRLGLADDDEI